jgi:hypothetical protein
MLLVLKLFHFGTQLLFDRKLLIVQLAGCFYAVFETAVLFQNIFYLFCYLFLVW